MLGFQQMRKVEDTPFRPEMELVRLLLNASDMQENRPPVGMTMTEVTISVEDDELDASWTFVPLAAQ